MSSALIALVAELLVERHVRVAVDRRDHGGLLPRRAELLDVGHDRLPVGMPERRVVDHDVLGRNPLRLQVRLEDLVRGARIDVVRPRQHPALHPFLVHQVVDRRDRLLVRRRAGIEDVALALLPLVLHRVEEDRVQLLEDRQHRLAADARPAAEDHVHALVGDEIARLLGEERPVRRRVDHDRLELLAQHPALRVLLLDQHQHDVLQRRLGDRHRPRERVQDADLDRVLLRPRRAREQRTGECGSSPQLSEMAMHSRPSSCQIRPSGGTRTPPPPADARTTPPDATIPLQQGAGCKPPHGRSSTFAYCLVE